jgi:hypothetical protein
MEPWLSYPAGDPLGDPKNWAQVNGEWQYVPRDPYVAGTIGNSGYDTSGAPVPPPYDPLSSAYVTEPAPAYDPLSSAYVTELAPYGGGYYESNTTLSQPAPEVYPGSEYYGGSSGLSADPNAITTSYPSEEARRRAEYEAAMGLAPGSSLPAPVASDPYVGGGGSPALAPSDPYAPTAGGGGYPGGGSYGGYGGGGGGYGEASYGGSGGGFAPGMSDYPYPSIGGGGGFGRPGGMFNPTGEPRGGGMPGQGFDPFGWAGVGNPMPPPTATREMILEAMKLGATMEQQKQAAEQPRMTATNYVLHRLGLSQPEEAPMAPPEFAPPPAMAPSAFDAAPRMGEEERYIPEQTVYSVPKPGMRFNGW